MTTVEGRVARPPGRPRSEETDRAILAAALDALVDDGFAAMTVEGVAARAGVGKATIYRRWPGKLELVLEAVNRRTSGQVPVPDTGDIRTDVAQMVEDLRRMMAGPDSKVAAAFTSELLRHPELADGFQRQFVAERRAIMQGLVAAAVERGQLPGSTDTELLGDVGAAIIWHRLLVTGAPLDEGLATRIVAQFFPVRP